LSRRGKKNDPKINGHQPAKYRIRFIDGVSIDLINFKMRISSSQHRILPQRPHPASFEKQEELSRQIHSDLNITAFWILFST
jgi:hypothetical protein